MCLGDLLPKNWPKLSENFIYTKTGPEMKDRFTQAQIISMIKEQESGLTVPEICRKYGIGASTFYRWKGQYGGMTLSEAQYLKHLEKEHQKLKTLVAELALDKVMLQDVLAKRTKPIGAKSPERHAGRPICGISKATLPASWPTAEYLSVSGHR